MFYSNLRLDSDLLSVEGRLSSALFAVDLGPPLLCPPVVSTVLTSSKAIPSSYSFEEFRLMDRSISGGNPFHLI